MTQTQKFPLQKDEEAFGMFDKDRNGLIDKAELLKVANDQLGKELTDTEAEDIIATVDGDGDQKINFIEFLRLMAQGILYAFREKQLS